MTSNDDTNENTNDSNENEDFPFQVPPPPPLSVNDSTFSSLFERQDDGSILFIGVETARASVVFSTALPMMRELQVIGSERDGAPCNGAHPTSARTLQTLQELAHPVWAPHGLLVPANNRECNICLGDYAVGGSVIRLPCGHRFHAECITPWLTKHCTCPDCRYELPTDCQSCERGRIERMASRNHGFVLRKLLGLSEDKLKYEYGFSPCLDLDGSEGRDAFADRIFASRNLDELAEWFVCGAENDAAEAAYDQANPAPVSEESLYTPNIVYDEVDMEDGACDLVGLD